MRLIEQSLPENPISQEQPPRERLQKPWPEQLFGQVKVGVSPGQFATHTPGPTSGIGERLCANE